MRIVLKRNIKIEQYQLFAVLNIHEIRPDVCDFLQKVKSGEVENKFPYNRMVDYLKNERLLQDRDTLSAIGEKVLKTGVWEIKEQGKYHFWCIVNDALAGTRLLALFRDIPDKIPQNNVESLPLSDIILNEVGPAVQFKLSYDLYDHWKIKEITSELKQSSIEKLGGVEMSGLRGGSGDASLIWEWTELEQSFFRVEGQVTVRHQPKTNNNKSLSPITKKKDLPAEQQFPVLINHEGIYSA